MARRYASPWESSHPSAIRVAPKIVDTNHLCRNSPFPPHGDRGGWRYISSGNGYISRGMGIYHGKWIYRGKWVYITGVGVKHLPNNLCIKRRHSSQMLNPSEFPEFPEFPKMRCPTPTTRYATPNAGCTTPTTRYTRKGYDLHTQLIVLLLHVH
jgi:hypothetical protein